MPSRLVAACERTSRLQKNTMSCLEIMGSSLRVDEAHLRGNGRLESMLRVAGEIASNDYLTGADKGGRTALYASGDAGC